MMLFLKNKTLQDNCVRVHRTVEVWGGLLRPELHRHLHGHLRLHHPEDGQLHLQRRGVRVLSGLISLILPTSTFVLQYYTCDQF